MTTCECGLLHTVPSRAGGCQECGTACCPSCAFEIDSRVYCRSCGTAPEPALS